MKFCLIPVALFLFSSDISAQRYKQMDYGPFVSAGIQTSRGQKCYRGMAAIKLNEKVKGGWLFDADRLQMVEAWTGDFKLEGTAYDGKHGGICRVPTDTWAAGASVSPGWAKEGSFEDPRESDVGPLPADWAKYRGLYRHGNRVVFSYTVGASGVLELPAIDALETGEVLFSRTFRVEPNKAAMQVMVAEASPPSLDKKGLKAQTSGFQIRFKATTKKAKFKRIDSRVIFELPAHAKPEIFKIYLASDNLEKSKLDAFIMSDKPVDPETLTKGGPSLWKETVTAKGTIAENTGPYVLDQIPIPSDNPYKSWMRPGGFDFFSDGTRAAVCTWSGDVWLVSGIDDKLEKVEWRRYASGIYQALGLEIVDDKVYVLGKDQITRLYDLNNDGEADFYENFNNDWEVTEAFHAFAFDLRADAAGNFYFAFGSPVQKGGRGFERIVKHHGKLIRVSADGKKMDIYASGLRAPNGIGVHPSGQVTASDNEGTFVPATPVHWVKEGGFLGVVDATQDREFKTPSWQDHFAKTKVKDPSDAPREKAEEPKPICWIPKNADNSGGGQEWVLSDRWGPFKDELLHLSYGRCCVFKVMKEEVNGQIQGGVIEFPDIKFSSTAMRARFNPRDGQLYVCGLKGWQTNAAKEGGLDRMRYTGKAVNMPSSLRVKPNGIEVTFTSPLNPEKANDKEFYSIMQWDYMWNASYGSSHYFIKNKGQKAKQPKRFAATVSGESVEVKSVKLLDDKKTVFIEIPDLVPVMQMRIKYNLEAADGTSMKQEIYNTIHEIPVVESDEKKAG
jgi:hypothetical protein